MIPKSINENDFVYRRLVGEEIRSFLITIENLLVLFASKMGIARSSIKQNFGNLAEIAVRIDQRADYFHYFHSEPNKIVKMSQTKHLALLAYWIVRYKPFSQGSSDTVMCYANNKCTINELIALLILKISVISASKKNSANATKFLYRPDVETDTIHTFMHGDITKESMILLFESLERTFA